MRALPCCLPPCPTHGGLCAYHADEVEADRCPYCHGTYAAIFAVQRGGYIDDRGHRQPYEWNETHSCEQNRRSYAAEARRLRQEAETAVPALRQSPCCAHTDPGSRDRIAARYAAESGVLA